MSNSDLPAIPERTALVFSPVVIAFLGLATEGLARQILQDAMNLGVIGIVTFLFFGIPGPEKTRRRLLALAAGLAIGIGIL